MSLLSLVGVSFYALQSGAKARTNQVLADLTARAHFAVEDMKLGVGSSSAEEIDAYCKKIGEKTGTRITLMTADGLVLGDSMANPPDMEPHGDRPEFRQALEEGVGTSQRYSGTLQRDMLYLAMRVDQTDTAIAAVRVSLPLLSMRQEFAQKRKNMVAATLFIGCLAALVSAWITRRITFPLQVAQHGVHRFAGGDFFHRLTIPDQQEVADLVLGLNHMAETLERRMRTIREQGEEAAAILAGLVEGVLAVGPNDRLLKINAAAADLLRIDLDRVEGRPIHEVLRHADLLNTIQRLRDRVGSESRDVQLQGVEERILEVNGSTLPTEEGMQGSVILVLHDVTRLRRLQRVRREFVANVSHELKSPIASIMGFAETLTDGAIEDPEKAKRFLGIIEHQSHRMYNIVEDLLQLSRIEDGSVLGETCREKTSIRPIFEAAIQQCSCRLDEKTMRLQLDCDETIEAHVNPPLLEQAMVNLIDNAVNYSTPNSEVLVQAVIENEQLVVNVSDQGEGIPQEHLPRLFERFYRVDKARSREVGGTGLGLAIVKHIMQAHRGNVSVTSTFGKGSTFTLWIPVA